MSSQRKLKIPPFLKEEKTNTTIRVSERTIKLLAAVRLHLAQAIMAMPNGKSDFSPWGFHNDNCLSLLLQMYARDYGVPLPEEKDDEPGGS